jgi:hypothetical protein
MGPCPIRVHPRKSAAKFTRGFFRPCYLAAIYHRGPDRRPGTQRGNSKTDSKGLKRDAAHFGYQEMRPGNELRPLCFLAFPRPGNELRPLCFPLCFPLLSPLCFPFAFPSRFLVWRLFPGRVALPMMSAGSVPMPRLLPLTTENTTRAMRAGPDPLTIRIDVCVKAALRETATLGLKALVSDRGSTCAAPHKGRRPCAVLSRPVVGALGGSAGFGAPLVLDPHERRVCHDFGSRLPRLQVQPPY